jgi:Cu+-exporting ATPase
MVLYAADSGSQTSSKEVDMVKDPVCGMQIEKTGTAEKAVYLDRTYYFCSSTCHKAFTAEPKRYAEAAVRESALGGSTQRRA